MPALTVALGSVLADPLARGLVTWHGQSPVPELEASIPK